MYQSRVDRSNLTWTQALIYNLTRVIIIINLKFVSMSQAPGQGQLPNGPPPMMHQSSGIRGPPP